MLGISRTPLTEPGYNSISHFFFKLFLRTATVANRSALSVAGPDSDLGELYCRLELVLVIAVASRRPHASPKSAASPGFLTLELGAGKCSETGFFHEHQAWDFA